MGREHATGDAARPLAAAGFSVTLFDLPGHGASGGQAASVVHAGRALLAFPQGIQVGRSVHFAGPSSLTPMVNGLAAEHGLGPADAAAFAGRVEGLIGSGCGMPG